VWLISEQHIKRRSATRHAFDPDISFMFRDQFFYDSGHPVISTLATLLINRLLAKEKGVFVKP
jgi:hypothetical protein